VSLTLKAEQHLIAVGLVDFFENDRAPWLQLAKATHTFVGQQYPAGATVRRDDVATAMVPLLEVNKALGGYLDANKLTQRYWFVRFADLILDRTWTEITP
jgi:hypothetical protein